MPAIRPTLRSAQPGRDDSRQQRAKASGRDRPTPRLPHGVSVAITPGHRPGDWLGSINFTAPSGRVYPLFGLLTHDEAECRQECDDWLARADYERSLDRLIAARIRHDQRNPS